MRLKNLLPLFSILLLSSAAFAQQAPPATAPAPDAQKELFSFYMDGGSFIGIYPEEVTRENMGRFNLREPRGVAVSKVVEGSPAERAGLRKDDVVLRFNGEEVTSVRKLNRLIGEVAPDHAARLTISRNGSEQEISVTVGKRKGVNALTLPRDNDTNKLLEDLSRAPNGAYTFALGSSRRIGVSTNTLTKQLADFFGVMSGRGVLVTNVREDSPAAKAGIRAGDVITEVDDADIEDVGDLSRAINRKSEGDVTLTIVRDKSKQTIRVTPEKGAAMQMFGPEFRIDSMPRIGQLNIPAIRLTPNIQKIMMPRIQAMPRIRGLLGVRPL